MTKTKSTTKAKINTFKEPKWVVKERAAFDKHWPEFKNDKERIKFFSRKYKELSIAEAFAKQYRLKLKDIDATVNEVPKMAVVGDFIPVRIVNIEKNHVDFDSNNMKTLLTSKVNLFKYEKFKHFTPKDTISAKVVRVDRDKVVVDPLGGMVDSWLQPILSNPTIQKKIGYPEPIRVKNLQLTRGGFMGDAVIPSVSEFVGEDFTIPAFIPGSQIVLNIADNFEDFIGKDVDAFILNYIQRPGTNKMSLICSVKELLKFDGECKLISMFNQWCDDSKEWEKITNTVYTGRVTGVINSSKKCGVFIEIPELNVTGMVNTKDYELVEYKKNQEVKINIKGFEEEMFFNSAADQMQHAEPYTISDFNCLEKCNLKPVLEFVK